MVSILKSRTLIKISGEDANSFLQQLTTNDINANNNIIYSMILSPQGRFLFDIFVFKDSDGFILDIHEPSKEMMIKKLNLYKINRKVIIEDLNDKLYYSRDEVEGEVCYKDPRFNKLGFRFRSNKEQALDNSYLEDKYLYTIPDGGVDLVYDKSMPQEYGAEQLSALSFSKGCYVGQEVISRTKYTGEVRKKLYKVIISNKDNLENISHGTEIFSNGKKIGIFCSGFKNLGIALIREVDLKADAKNFQLQDFPIDLIVACWY